ncbi:efflux RND transporter permease subunit [uncultured Phycicoccus sp.]|uniref:efflux RND transporter permease subunit n=1 Tax=uncultured Phycicoccus sp. TaxID=661422 RepID=UPI0026387C17|nr:efflux RND transporter permease subunit [uncultured Phycicoccus sp.]
MRRILTASLRFRFIVVAASVAMLVVGGLQLRDTPVDVFPEFAPPRVEVQTDALGLSAQEVEELITVPLEQGLTGMPGLDTLRSKSIPQQSSIELIFVKGTDVIEARRLVSERIQTITPTLPSWATPPVVLQPLSATSRVMKIGIRSDSLDLIEQATLVRYKIRPELMSLPGVANVAVWGMRKNQWQIQIDPERMRAEGVTLEQVMAAASAGTDAGLLKHRTGTKIGTGGYVDSGDQRYIVQHVLPLDSAETLKQIVVDRADDRTIVMGDVAEVVKGHQLLIGDAVINDGDGLLLIVEKLPWGNTLDVTHEVEESLAAMAPALEELEIDTTIFRPASFVELAIDNLTQALTLGILLVAVVLVFFLFQWRTAVISLVAIPLSLVAAAYVLHLRGETTNTMVLAGLVIAVGVVVDDAIIDVENIVRRLREHRAQGGTRSTASIVLDASMEVRSPIVYATLIILAAAIPVFFLTGLMGSFFQPLALSYTLAVAASMLVAVTVTPAMALILLRRATLQAEAPRHVRALQGGYTRVLRRTVRRPLAAYVIVAALVVGGAAVVPRLGQDLLPTFRERDFLMHWVLEPSASYDETMDVTRAASRELREVPGVRNFGAHVGQAAMGDEVYGIYFVENWISIDPDQDYEATLDRVQTVVDGYPGLRRDVQTYLKERIREVLTGAGEAVVVRVFGDDLDVIEDKAHEIEDAIAGIPGVRDPHTDLQTRIPHLVVEVDLDKAQAVGLKPGDVRRQTAIYLAAEELSDVFRTGKAYDVMVWSVPEARQTPDHVRDLLIDTPGGDTVRLGDIASVEMSSTPSMIRRIDGSRRLDVGANVEGRPLADVAADVEAAAMAVELPVGYRVEVSGEDTERAAASQRLRLLSGVAFLAILGLLYGSFRRWRLAVLSLLTLPMALVGGVLAAWLTGGTMTIGSFVGLFTVLGIAARNGILMISHCQHLEAVEGVTFGPELVVRAAKERLAPILMTTLATALALVPLVVMGDVPGHEIEYPMAIVILGGLLTSTLLNLFVVPSLYLRFGRPREAPAYATQPDTRVLGPQRQPAVT